MIVTGLKRLQKHDNEEIRQEADGALWILEEKEKQVNDVVAAVQNENKGKGI